MTIFAATTNGMFTENIITTLVKGKDFYYPIGYCPFGNLNSNYSQAMLAIVIYMFIISKLSIPVEMPAQSE